MIPENRLSTQPATAELVEQISRGGLLTDSEMGGVAISDASQGLMVKLWTARYDRGTGDVLLSAEDVPETVLFTRSGITELSLAFDQNMHPFIAFMQGGEGKFWWYDPLIPGHTFSESLLGSVQMPRCTLDDKRPTQTGNSDIILAYLRAGGLYFRMQRDRYEVEYLLTDQAPAGQFVGIAMNKAMRLQFVFDSGQVSPELLAADRFVDIRCSKDGGHNWTGWVRRSLGDVGEFQKRVRRYRFGQGRQWVFDIRVTSPVKADLLAMSLQASGGPA